MLPMYLGNTQNSNFILIKQQKLKFKYLKKQKFY